MDLKEQSESREKKWTKAFLERLTNWFGTKKEIERIKVISGTNKFWCSNAKKIRFWKNLSERQSKNILGMKNVSIIPTVRITKVVYK
jgi:hypothetical protein